MSLSVILPPPNPSSHKLRWARCQLTYVLYNVCMGGNDFTRLLDKESRPSKTEIINTIGTQSARAWDDIRLFLDTYYDFTPELTFYGKKYGWAIRYRKSGKTLCSLFPETGAFTVLITLGKKEIEKTMGQLDEFSREMQELVISTPQTPRWQMALDSFARHKASQGRKEADKCQEKT